MKLSHMVNAIDVSEFPPCERLEFCPNCDCPTCRDIDGRAKLEDCLECWREQQDYWQPKENSDE